MDVAIILDLSGSQEDEYQRNIMFARNIVYGLNMEFDRTRVATVAYSTDIVDVFYLNQYQSKEAVINALNYYHKGGSTNTQEALRVMRQDIFTFNRGDRSGVRNVAILISDGESNVNKFNTVREAEQAKNAGIEIFTVASGENIDLNEMNEVASDPDSEHVYRVRDVNEVDSVSGQLLDRLCQ
jgi:collagen type VI alpha